MGQILTKADEIISLSEYVLLQPYHTEFIGNSVDVRCAGLSLILLSLSMVGPSCVPDRSDPNLDDSNLRGLAPNVHPVNHRN